LIVLECGAALESVSLASVGRNGLSKSHRERIRVQQTSGKARLPWQALNPILCLSNHASKEASNIALSLQWHQLNILLEPLLGYVIIMSHLSAISYKPDSKNLEATEQIICQGS
jgi:hypothetical protein